MPPRAPGYTPGIHSKPFTAALLSLFAASFSAATDVSTSAPTHVSSSAAAGVFTGPQRSSATSPAPESEDRPEPRRLALGLNDEGGQIRLHIKQKWAVEARFLTGTSPSNDGTVRSQVFGLRGYRFFNEHYRCRLYLGLEGSFAKTWISSPDATTSGVIANVPAFGHTMGFAGGGFLGVEYRLARRVDVDMDMGPYWIRLDEQATNTQLSSWDYVLNMAVLFYVF